MPGTAADEKHGAARIRIPDEVAPDGAAQLEPVFPRARPGQIGRDLPVVDPLDGQFDPEGRRQETRSNSSAGLISVVSGQTNVDVLTGPVTGPVPDVEGEGLDPICLGHTSATSATCQFSRPVPLFLPRVSVDVVAVRTPRSRARRSREAKPPHPLGALPEVQMRHEQPRRPAVLGSSGSPS